MRYGEKQGQWRCRPLAYEDGPLTFLWRSDARVVAGAEVRVPPNAAEHGQWLRSRIEGKVREHPPASIVLCDGNPVGMFTVIHEDQLVVSIGYMVAESERGQGYGTVIRGLALEFIRTVFACPVILKSKIRVENTASLIIALKAGSRITAVEDGFVMLSAQVLP